MRRAIYAGTFDPVTNGHLDVLRRACEIFDEVIVVVATNAEKRPLLSVETRYQLIKENLTEFPNSRAEILEGLTVDFARKLKAQAIVRGLRAVSDFEFEFQLAQMNRDLAPEIETIFLMPKQEHFYTSSSLVKAAAQYAPDRVAKLIPTNTLLALKEAYGHTK